VALESRAAPAAAGAQGVSAAAAVHHTAAPDVQGPGTEVQQVPTEV
jgi:hypothetical protein